MNPKEHGSFGNLRVGTRMQRALQVQQLTRPRTTPEDTLALASRAVAGATYTVNALHRPPTNIAAAPADSQVPSSRIACNSAALPPSPRVLQCP